MRTSFVSGTWAAALSLSAMPAAAQQYYDMANYWLMPPNTYTELYTVFKTGPNPPCAPRNPELGTHTFWRGTFMGKNVALQGGIFDGTPQHPGHDIFELADSGHILYWGTFRGNLPKADQVSHAFSTAVVWMKPFMTAGGGLDSSKVQGSTENHEMSNRLRRVTNQGQWCYSVAVEEHLNQWKNTFDPNYPNVVPWSDVLRVVYENWECAAPAAKRKEEYWLALGYGTVGFKSHDPAERSCVDYQYATNAPDQPPPSYQNQQPAVPWYDAFRWETHVKNGFFEDPRTGNPPPTSGPLSEKVASWGGGPDAVAASDPGQEAATGEWYAALKVAPSSGLDLAISDPVTVTADACYSLGGWLKKSSSADQVYLDLTRGDNGVDLGQNIVATTVGWQPVGGDAASAISVGSATTVRVRCVREGANAGDAGCDGITLQRVACPGGPPGGSGGGGSGGGLCLGGAPNGVCDSSEIYVELNDDGTSERRTTCPDDCPSCGSIGGDHCSQTGTCPSGYSFLDQTYDCPACCEVSPLPTCGTMGGNHCSQTGSCPAGYNSLGPSSDCNPCCVSCTSTGCPSGSCGWQTDNCGRSIWCGSCLQSCGQMGGDHCSQSGSCPPGYNSLGPSSDCLACCQQGPSCGSLGGDHCSQNGSCPEGYADLGRTWDCNHCCLSQ